MIIKSNRLNEIIIKKEQLNKCLIDVIDQLDCLNDFIERLQLRESVDYEILCLVDLNIQIVKDNYHSLMAELINLTNEEWEIVRNEIKNKN